MIQIRIVMMLALALGGVASSVMAQSPRTKQSRLVRILTGRSESVRMNALMRLRNDAALISDSLDDLIVSIKKQAEEMGPSGFPPSMVEMVHQIGSVDRPESEAALVELLDHENADIAMLSAEVLGRYKFYDSIQHLKRQVSRSEYAERYAFRFNLIRALMMMQHPDAIELITEWAPRLDGQLRYEIEKVLWEVTVEDFRGDTERYEKWRRGGDEDQPVRVANFAAQEGSYDERIRFDQPRQYYGIEIRAARVMFIIDHSGSMKAPSSSGSRLMRAKHELIRAIRELPEDSEFAIVAYDSVVRAWKEELCPADEEHKRAAIRYVQRLEYGKDTNTYGALRKSLDFDDDLEAVFLLTDGKPTAGQIINRSQIAGDILHRNRWRHLNFNTIGISVGGATESFLRTLAENSGGQFRAAN